jgi:hypothetical protein
MERFVKVPVKWWRYDVNGDVGFGVKLNCKCEEYEVAKCGFGSTEEEAFTNLLEKLGYEEVK